MTSFKELKELVGKAEGRLPSAKSLKDREDIVVHEECDGAAATVFSTGHILYTREEHSTVYTVERCRKMETQTDGKIDAETAESYRQQGYEVENGCLYISEKFYENLPWFEVISMICEERLDHNQESREGSHTDFSLDNDGNDWDEHTWLPDFVEEMFRQQDEEEKDAENHKKLMLALDSLTEKQRMVVKLYFGKEGMTEKKVADKLGISQQAVHKSLAAAVRKIRTFF